MQIANKAFTRTRLAPTPSGYLHIGNILSFAITAAIAKRTNARILLRIDDADRERTNLAYVQDIFDTLNFLEIPWHEGPKNVQEYSKEYSQLFRMDLYRQALEELRATGELFACSCSRTQVLAINADGAYPGTCIDKQQSFETEHITWRICADERTVVEVKNLDGTITNATLPHNMSGFIVRKRDGFPAYQLTSLIDDLYFGVDLVVRGADLWPSTVAQLYLAKLLNKTNFLQTTFYHHPLLNDASGHKLSKSEGATSVHYLRRDGKSPSYIYGQIAAMFGVSEPIHNWEQLITLVEDKLNDR